MNDAEIRARAEAIWTIAIQGDPEGAKLMSHVDEMTLKLCCACFVNGYVAGAMDRSAKTAGK